MTDPTIVAPLGAAPLKAPFPWWGGKSTVASLIWERLGDVPNFVDPFAGSLAILLGRPHEPRIETVNDADCYLANFWRALQADPEAVARWADWPVNECDLHARHRWLLDRAEFRERMVADPDYYDAKIAGWWAWGICQWIGSGWCDERYYAGDEWRPRPHLGDAGMGLHRPSQKRPHLGNAGMGLHRPSQKLPHLGNAGRGLHRPSQKRPHLGFRQGPVQRSKNSSGLLDYFEALADRLRRVRVCCGDWTRVLGPTPTEKLGLTGILLDPPYSHDERQADLYAVESDIADDVGAWAIANGSNPMLRIALCGYEGEHEMPADWATVRWKARGGYGAGRGTRADANSHRERIYFSPHCLDPRQRDLFAAAGVEVAAG